jgi:putative Mn2+ efflux pump MntP
MFSVIWFSMLLGMDGFAVSLGLGPLIQGRTRYAIAATFGLCDGTAILLTHLLPTSFASALSPLGDRLLPAVLMAYAIYVVILARNAQALIRGWAGWLVLPIATSIDNLAAGAHVSSTVPLGVFAFVVVLVSAAMSLAALRLSQKLQKSLRVIPGWPAVACFLVATAFLS